MTSTGAGTVLTLGQDVTIDDEFGYGEITDSGYAGDGIVDQGNITVGGILTILGNSFTNSGTITAGTSALTIEPTTFTNSGTLAISDGDAVTIDAANLSNTGSITLARSLSA